MISPHDDTLHQSAGEAGDPVPTRLPDRQRSARTDPAMRDGDSSHGNPYESGPTTFGEFGSDTDVGDAVPEGASAADVIPVGPGEPGARGPRSVTLPNTEAAVVPTADMTSTGAARNVSDDDDDMDEAEEATALAEEATGGWNHAAAAGADHEDRSDENNRAIRAESAPARNGRRAGRKDEDYLARRDDVPIEGYRSLTVPEILDRVFEMPVRQAREVQRYEGSHRRRKTLLVKLERYLRDKQDEPAVATR